MMQDFLELIKKRRTIRQFKPEEIPDRVLLKLAEAGRLAPSAANLQPLEFVLVKDPEVRRKIFPCLRWAAYISRLETQNQDMNQRPMWSFWLTRR